MEINVVGGVYREICTWPERNSLLGSAGRAADCMSSLSSENSIVLYSELSEVDQSELNKWFAFKKNVTSKITTRGHTPLFKYTHPLARPEIYHVNSSQTKFQIDHDFVNSSVLLFGMIDRNYQFNAETIVYDPQNTDNPELLSEDNIQAKNVIYVLNRKELTTFYSKFNSEKEETIENMSAWLMQCENVNLIVVKCGARGAFVYESESKQEWVPAFVNKGVNPVGSGDCFAAAFTHYYLSKSLSPSISARKASIATSFYCENGTLVSDKELLKYEERAKPITTAIEVRKKVYLAGPFFSLSQMWLVNEAKSVIEAFGMDVHSPYHELGFGPAELVAPADIKAINECDVVFALMDNHDPGTLFEIGYAIKANKKVVIYTENSTEEALKMFKGTGCVIESDFSTSIYRLSWLK